MLPAPGTRTGRVPPPGHASPISVFKQEEKGNPQTSWEEQGQVLALTSPSSPISQDSRSFKAPSLGAGIR